MSSYDVLIVGYGPTGATAAALLGREGLRVLVIDAAEGILDFPRAVHFDDEVKRVFQDLGIAEDLEDISDEAKSLHFLNRWGWRLIESNLEDGQRPQGWATGNFFNQPPLEKRLRECAAEHENVGVRLGVELLGFSQGEKQVVAEIRDTNTGELETVQALYLLGCDGASSLTRAQLGIELEDLGCDEPWLVVDVMLDDGPACECKAYQLCDPARPTTMIQSAGPHLRWEFMLNPGEDPKVMEQPGVVHRLMQPHIHHLHPDLKPADGTLVRARHYNFHALIAESFQQGRVFILGDAAHQTPPFLGQGMCGGIRDAYNLCWKMSGVIQGNYHPALLETYTSERRPHFRAVLKQALRVGSVIQARNPVAALARDCFLMLGKLVPRLTRGLRWAPTWTLGPGLFLLPGAPERTGAPGHPLPQPMVSTEKGEPVLFDQQLPSGFSLVSCDPAHKVKLERAISQNGNKVAVNYVPVKSTSDMGQWLAKRHKGRAALVRPDRQVYALLGRDSERVEDNEVEEAIATLSRQLCEHPVEGLAGG